MRRWMARLGAMVVVCALGLGAAFYWNPLWFADQRIRWHLRQQGVASHYRTVDGYRVHYFEAQPAHGAEGTPLLLVHGLGGRGEDWSGMIPTLTAAGFHVYALDLIGYGRSERPDVDYAIGFEEKIVADFMHGVGVERADVGGWSMGGWVTLKLAIDHPEMVRRLVVYDSAGLFFEAGYDASLFLPQDVAGLERLQDRLTPSPKPPPGFAARAALRRLQGNAWVVRRSVDAMVGGKDLLDGKLAQVRVPTLVVWGRQDTLIPLSAGEAMHRGIPKSSLLVVDGCGHLAPAECAQPVLAATVRFLRVEPVPVGEVAMVPGK